MKLHRIAIMRRVCFAQMAAISLCIGGIASADTLRTDVETLSSPAFSGRSIGTPGSAQAAEYLAGRLEDVRAEPLAGNTYLLPVAINEVVVSGASGSLSADGQPIAEVGRDLSVSQGLVGPVEIEAALTLVRYTATSTSFPEGFDPEDLNGHLVIAQRADPPSNPLGDRAGTLLGRLAESRPAAVLTATPDLGDLLDMETGASVRKYRLATAADDALGGRIDAGVVDGIFGAADAMNDGGSIEIRTLESTGRLEITLDEVEPRALDEVNVAGTVPGSITQDTRILLTAHYDHLGTFDGTIFPGADDNASGVAVLLGAIQRLAANPAEVAVDVAFFTGEEHGLLGSTAFVDAPPISLSSYRAVINVDAVGRPFADQAEFAGSIFASGADCFPAIGNALDVGAHETALRILRFDDVPALVPLSASCEAQRTGTGGAPADQIPFLTAGVPAVLLTGGLHADYHQPGDTSDKLDYDRLNRLSRLVEIAVRSLAVAR